MAVDLHPVVRGQDLPDGVVVGVDANVVGLHAEDAAQLGRRAPVRLRDAHLHHEASARLEVGGGVGEDGHLPVLGGQVHDGVPHQVDELERAVHPRGCHVADGDRHRCGAGLGPELLRHVG